MSFQNLKVFSFNIAFKIFQIPILKLLLIFLKFLILFFERGKPLVYTFCGITCEKLFIQKFEFFFSLIITFENCSNPNHKIIFNPL